jgi:glycosyltransferase involved in cell wall biosynthesis
MSGQGSSSCVVVIPAYNEGETVRDVVGQVLKFCPKVIVVDDASTDATAQEVADLPITLLRNEQNLGKGRSLWKGIQTALESGAEAVLTLDADGQHHPEDIPAMLQAGREQPNCIIIGSRLLNLSSFPFMRRMANGFANFWISWACAHVIVDSQSGFRLYPRDLFTNLRISSRKDRGFVFESEILIEGAKQGYLTMPVPIRAVYPRDARPSHYRALLDSLQIARMVTWKLISRGIYPVGFYRAFLKTRQDKARTFMLYDLAMFLFSGLLILATAGISFLWQLAHVIRTALGPQTELEAKSILVVLGARLYNGQVSVDYAKRLDKALLLWKKNPSMKVVIVGGQTDQSPFTEAQKGRAFLMDWGVPKEVIYLEDSSNHTLQNLLNARDLVARLGGPLPAFITNRYHLARCHVIAESMGWDHLLLPAEERFSLNAKVLKSLLWEAFFLHWYRVGLTWSRWTHNRRMLARIE